MVFRKAEKKYLPTHTVVKIKQINHLRFEDSRAGRCQKTHSVLF